MVGLIFSIFNFFINKIYQVNKLNVEKNTYLRKPAFRNNMKWPASIEVNLDILISLW